jgi:hypothetical protein
MGTLGKNIEDVREFVGQRVGDMRMQVEDRLGEISSQVGATRPPRPWIVFAAGLLVGAIAMHFVDR